MACQFTLPLMVVSIAISIAGLYIFLKPAEAIRFQKEFYAKINWRIEPIDMQKELRNTRIMGLFLIIAAILSLILLR